VNRRASRAIRRGVFGGGIAVMLAVLAACGSSSKGSAPSGSAAPATTLPASPGAGKKFYVSVGDSYAAGYQPTTSREVGNTTTNGFAYRLTSDATVRGQRLTLVNFGCAGATTVSLLHAQGCLPKRLGPGAASYPGQTQAQAAVGFITAHKADVALVTVVIGGNDITSCAWASNVATCLTKALVSVNSNLRTFLGQLRAATGPATPIVGITYPDVILGSYVSTKASQRSLAPLSVTAFKSLVNPALRTDYQAVGATFVDVTTATGAYLPFSQTTQLAPYGTLPVAVAKACELTYYCQFQDIHPRNNGYQLIADLIRKVLPVS
jgi:lysophospholipase L1-like esterase